MPVITYLEAIRQALFDEMARDERVFIMGEDIGAYGGALAFDATGSYDATLALMLALSVLALAVTFIFSAASAPPRP